MQKIIILLGILFILIGLMFPFLKNLGLGHLPGDIIIKRQNFSFYFPLTTCILISVVISIIWWFFNK